MASSRSELRSHMLKNAAGVKLRNYADGLYINFPMDYSAQLKQFIWNRLRDEADRLGVEIGQHVDE